MPFPAFDFGVVGLYHERLCLDFVNSTGQHNDPGSEHLRSYADLLAWSLDVSLLTQEEADYLYAQSLARPEEAADLLSRALELREAIYVILSNAAREQPPPAEALGTLNRTLTEAMRHLRLAVGAEHFFWEWVYEADDLGRMLGPVAWSAAEVLQSADCRILRVCEGHDCDWMFLDTSRNHSRRWCSMETCGNRAKARRHYQRGRSAAN